MELTDGWEVAGTAPGACEDPGGLDALSFSPARVPGTVAAAVDAAGRDLDRDDWWFRVAFDDPRSDPAQELVLALDGIATVAEVYLNGELLLRSESMWRSHAVPVGARLKARNELAIVCRALAPLLRRRRRPPARWRTRVINETNLRWYRTMMFGRSPGFAAGPAPVGPWRPVRLVAPAAGELTLRPRLEGEDGVLDVGVAARAPVGEAQVRLGDHRAPLTAGADGSLRGELLVPGVRRWWPHTHGEPVLHEVEVTFDAEPIATRRVGFRALGWEPDIAEHGLDLRVNDVPVFLRGAVWTPSDLVSMAPAADDLRRTLEAVRDGGMNMLRVVGTGAYESPAFHDLCDELGILVWQDLMFANLDYPLDDDDFRELVRAEARTEIARLAGRPSLAVVCGNSEVEQQPAMMGLDPALGRHPFFDSELPSIVDELGADCAYVRSTPCGGDLPFQPARGITHYFAVSGYFAPPEEARRAEVRFAAECLAFANVPDEVEVPPHHPDWKRAVPRDAGTGWDLGAGWDFDDVRDHYLRLLFGVDPVGLRRYDLTRYLELSRAASGEVMAEVMGEWRRRGSPCRGALVLWCRDMIAGAGLGILDRAGAPKVAYHHLRRALAPVAVWTTDEGVGGVAIHVANDRAEPLRARLRVALYRDLETPVADVTEQLELGPHAATERTVEGMLGRFVDPAWAYRFGPPAQDVIAVALERPDAPHAALSRAFRFPAGRPTMRETAARLGVRGTATVDAAGDASVALRSERVLYGARLAIDGFVADDDAFCLEPGREQIVAARPSTESARLTGATLSALNLDGVVRIDVA